MRKEGYDIINELGSQNWLDVAAGEAVLLGQLTHDVELTMKGTRLAELLDEIKYDNDQFSKVEAEGMGLTEKINIKKNEQNSAVFIDEICEYRNGIKRSDTWEYELILCQGRYQIRLVLPEYYGLLPANKTKENVEEIIKNSYTNPLFAELEKSDSMKMIGHQKMDTTDYYTDMGMIICQIIDFEHESGTKKGMTEIYHFDDSTQVSQTWSRIRAILSRKR